MKYEIKIDDDDNFEMYIDGQYSSVEPFVFIHLENIAETNGVDLTGCTSESEQLARLIVSGVDVVV